MNNLAGPRGKTKTFPRSFWTLSRPSSCEIPSRGRKTAAILSYATGETFLSLSLFSDLGCVRRVIMRQLLNEEIDPFTRKPLTPAQLVPVTELKQKIDDWVALQIAQAEKK